MDIRYRMLLYANIVLGTCLGILGLHDYMWLQHYRSEYPTANFPELWTVTSNDNRLPLKSWNTANLFWVNKKFTILQNSVTI